jgi:hypothetical protein
MNEALRQLEVLLSNSAARPPRFPPNSRYNGLPTLTTVLPDGRAVAYVARRFIDAPAALGPMREHEVAQGDRIDLLASNYLSDPELWWKIADANVALVPAALTAAPGTALLVPLGGFPTGARKI